MTTKSSQEPAGLTVIADSSGLVSLVNPQDSNHQRAVRSSAWRKSLQGSILVPDAVFTETINVLGKKIGHAVAVAVAERILTSSAFVVAESADDVRERAVALFRTQPASVSLTDCVVMAYAERYEATEIFGFDEVFARNGYQLPEPLPEAA